MICYHAYCVSRYQAFQRQSRVNPWSLGSGAAVGSLFGALTMGPPASSAWGENWTWRCPTFPELIRTHQILFMIQLLNSLRICHRQNKLPSTYQLLITLQFTFKKVDMRNMPALYVWLLTESQKKSCRCAVLQSKFIGFWESTRSHNYSLAGRTGVAMEVVLKHIYNWAETISWIPYLKPIQRTKACFPQRNVIFQAFFLLGAVWWMVLCCLSGSVACRHLLPSEKKGLCGVSADVTADCQG